MSSYFNKNIQASCNQNILLGTTFRFMADALNREPACLSDLEETKAKSVLALSGSDAESTEKVRKIEEGQSFLCCVSFMCCPQDKARQQLEHSFVDLKYV